MQYLIDKNILTKRYKENVEKRSDICVLQDVLEEAEYTETDLRMYRKSGVQILKLAKKHIEKLKEVMTAHGNNLSLIDLYTGKGVADVAMISFILVETEVPGNLFSDEFTIVTNDQELIAVAGQYGIPCIYDIPQ
jgi:rRNA-processing protein FCF1